MAHSSAYRFVIAAEAFRFLLTLRASERQTLDHAFQALADNPHLPGDYQERDEIGRSMEVLLVGRFLLTFWADHAVKEVRVIRVRVLHILWLTNRGGWKIFTALLDLSPS